MLSVRHHSRHSYSQCASLPKQLNHQPTAGIALATEARRYPSVRVRGPLRAKLLEGERGRRVLQEGRCWELQADIKLLLIIRKSSTVWDKLLEHEPAVLHWPLDHPLLRSAGQRLQRILHLPPKIGGSGPRTPSYHGFRFDLSPKYSLSRPQRTTKKEAHPHRVLYRGRPRHVRSVPLDLRRVESGKAEVQASVPPDVHRGVDEQLPNLSSLQSQPMTSLSLPTLYISSSLLDTLLPQNYPPLSYIFPSQINLM